MNPMNPVKMAGWLVVVVLGLVALKFVFGLLALTFQLLYYVLVVGALAGVCWFVYTKAISPPEKKAFEPSPEDLPPFPDGEAGIDPGHGTTRNRTP